MDVRSTLVEEVESSQHKILVLQIVIITRHGNTKTSRSNLMNHSTDDTLSSLTEVMDVCSRLGMGIVNAMEISESWLRFGGG